MLLLFLLFISPGHDGINAYQVGDCGIRYNKFLPSIALGSPSTPNDFPWHVAIYRRDKSSKYQYICGGSIIDSDIVITGAHCVFDEVRNDLDNSTTVIAAGKYNSSWAHRDIFEQRFEVISKKVPSTYRGRDNRFQDDIALLALNDSIKFSDIVMPICVDWGRSFEPNEEEMGTVVGWGMKKTNVLSEELQVSEMQQRNFGECRNNTSKAFTSYLTSDKFCAIEKESKSTDSVVQQGFGGSALVFNRKHGTDSSYFIKGILSGREKDNSYYYFFTNISSHLPWINSTKLSIIAEANLRKGKHE